MAERVAHFLWSLDRGGAERQAATLLRRIDRARYEPHLILVGDRDDFGVSREVPTRVLSANGRFDPACFPRLVAALREIRPAVVHSWMGAFNLYARLAAPLAGVRRVVGSVRAMNIPRVDVLREAMTRPLVDAIIVNSVGTRDELVRRAGVAPSKIEVIENGLDPQHFTPLAPDDRVLARRALGFEGRRALVVPARICAQKNQLGILDAFEAMRATGALPGDAKVFFYGRVDEQGYTAEVRARATSPALRDHVELRDPVADLERVLPAADALLLPSVFEGLPNVVIEALACGTPAIVTPAANVDVLVVDGRDGLVAADPTPAAIADALSRFFALDATALAGLSRRARENASSRFSIERMVSATTAVYDRVLSA